jgi:uncharacterized membrane protein
VPDQPGQQKLRDVLREATREQPEVSPVAARQLSPRERDDLRRLLRSQQQDWSK